MGRQRDEAGWDGSVVRTTVWPASRRMGASGLCVCVVVLVFVVGRFFLLGLFF
jgi:preprotein translocase subunit SecE